jgi:hypothetical protein
MGRLGKSVPNLLLALLLPAFFGCGGRSSGTQIPPPLPPPPQPDFSIGFSQSSVNVQQGSTSSSVSLSVNALNGFTGTVQVTISGLPPGVVSNPASPFGVAAGSSTAVLFSAAADSAAGDSTIVATGTSGSLSHPANLGLTIQTGMARQFGSER